MTRSDADVLIHRTQFTQILNSIRASRRGIGLVLIFASLALLLSIGGNLLLAQTVSANRHMILDLKSELDASGKGAEAEAIAPSSKINEVSIFGKPGKDGKDGEDGLDGVDGRDGSSGATGDRGPAGARGATGAPGISGKPGATGSTGPTGATGSKGDAGPAGDTGERGARGLPGNPGPAGIPGAVGPKGEKGDKGDPGVTPELPVFIVDFEQGGECSITFFYSNNTSKSIDICP